MYIINNQEQFNTACAEPGRQIYTKAEIGNVTLYGDGNDMDGAIVSFTLEDDFCPSEGISLGTACMNSLQIKLRLPAGGLELRGAEIKPYIGLEVNGQVEYVPLGYFYATDIETDDGYKTANITAYDYMYALTGTADFSVLGITFPCKAIDVLHAIAEHFEFEINNNFAMQLLSSERYVLYGQTERLLLGGAGLRAQVQEPIDGTYRDYIGWCCGLIGCNAHFGRDNKLELKFFGDGPAYTIGRDVQYQNGTTLKTGGSVTYWSIESGTDENPVYPTRYSGLAFRFENPFITSEMLDIICGDIIGTEGLTITPCNVEWRGNPCVDAGDIFNVVDHDGNNQTVYAMNNSISVTGGMKITTNCYGDDESASALNVSPSAVRLNRINAQLEKKVEEASDVVANTQGTFEFIPKAETEEVVEEVLQSGRNLLRTSSLRSNATTRETNETSVKENSGFIIKDEDGKGLLKCTAEGLSISSDGGLTYTNAITKDGIIASRLRVYNSAGMQIMYGGQDDIGESLFYLADSDGDRVFQVYPTSTGAEMRFASSTGSTLLRIFSADTGSALYLNNASGHTLFSVTAGSENGNLALHNPSGSRVLFGVASFRDSNDLEQLTFYTNNRDGNQIFGITTYRTSTSSTSYADEAVVRFTNPFSRKNILTLESSKFSSGNTSTSAVFGQDENGAGTVDINATGSYLEITKRSGSTVYFIQFQMAEIMSTGGNTIEPTITYGYRTDSGGYSSKTMTTKTVSIGGTNRTIFAT